jgi:hypothetical protein
MGLVDRLKAAVTPIPPDDDGGEDDLFTDVETEPNPVDGSDGDDTTADQSGEVNG